MTAEEQIARIADMREEIAQAVLDASEGGCTSYLIVAELASALSAAIAVSAGQDPMLAVVITAAAVRKLLEYALEDVKEAAMKGTRQ